MNAELLDTALRYQEMGLSVIPLRKDKRPLISWNKYQRERASPQQIQQWWDRWPHAMIGIVTGAISGLCVVDIDTEEGARQLNTYIPVECIGPTARTPRNGTHRYFQCPPGLGNNSRAIPGCDLRANGGYVVAPPSINDQGGCYTWVEGLSLFDAAPPTLPRAYLDALGACQSRETRSQQCQQMSASVSKMSASVSIDFTQGHRDETLFHIANCLIKGGMPPEKALLVLTPLARSCSPAYPLEDIPRKIDSALKRRAATEGTLASEIRQWVTAAPGTFSVAQLDRELNLHGRKEANLRAKVLERLCQEGLVERTGEKRGYYRHVDTTCEPIDFLNAPTQDIPLQWPFQIEKHFRAMAKNIIVIAGEPNAGKTAFLLNFARLNMEKHRIRFFSSEMGPAELKDRLAAFPIPLRQWSRVDFLERSDNFGHVIRADDINVIDFLEITSDFYRVAEFIKEIFDKLHKGIALIAIQKNRNTDYGLGRERSMEKARLYLAMEPGTVKIVKCKNWANPKVNPQQLQCEFTLSKGCEFTVTRQWHR